LNASGINRHHILLLDNHAHDRQTLKQGLADLGFETISEAADPIAALDIMHDQAVDTLITERYIPFVKFLRTSEKRPAAYIPIIMVCGKKVQAKVQEAIDAGVNRVIIKPVMAENLRTNIQRVLDEPQPFVESAAYIGPDRRRSENTATQHKAKTNDEPDLRLTAEEIAVLLERT